MNVFLNFSSNKNLNELTKQLATTISAIEIFYPTNTVLVFNYSFKVLKSALASFKALVLRAASKFAYPNNGFVN